MNKTELIEKISIDFDTKKDASKALETILTAITESLKKGEDITFVGFGSFKIVKKEKRKGRNPQTGEEVIIPAKRAVKFVPGKNLKEYINK